MNRGLFYKFIEDYDKTLANYNKALELAPKNLLAHERRAELYEKLKNNPAAGGDYEKIIEETDTKNLDGYCYLEV